ncbi:hypothetical protein GEMRC1_006726 [Eukaryota sp. GEM-RC1]
MDQILQNAQRADSLSPLFNVLTVDPAIRQQAEADLNRIKTENPQQYMSCLSQELTNDHRNPSVRFLAGLNLKNAIDIKRGLDNAQMWMNLPESTRTEIKSAVFRNLASKVLDARKASAQVIAKIALIELPQGLWPDLIQHLVSTTSHHEEYLRGSVLKTLGFICEEIAPEILEPQSSAILSGICNGLKPEEVDANKVIACEALYNSLDFISTNMNETAHRKFLMDQIFNVMRTNNSTVQTKALMCINKIAGFYYEKLEDHMSQIFEVTSAAIKSTVDDVAKQGIEFWSTLAAVEEELHEEAQLAAEERRPPSEPCFEFTRRVLPYIVPLILQSLTRIEEYDEEEEMTVGLTAANCLEQLSSCVGDDIVDIVLPFLSANIVSADWRDKDAAVMAFGSIMNGPSSTKLEPLIDQGIPALINFINDPSVSVKDSAIWALGQICAHHPDAVKDKWMPNLMTGLYAGLADEPRVANNACSALYNLAESFVIHQDQPTHALSPYVFRAIQELLRTSARSDADMNNLRISAYDALNSVILYSAEDTLATISELVRPLIDRMKQTFSQTALTAEDKDTLFEVQSQLCGLFHALCTRLRGAIRPFADDIMSCFLEVLKFSHKTVFEEVLMAVGALANAIGEDFLRYMDAFGPHLMTGLSAIGSVSVLSLAIGAAGDVSRALDTKFVPYLDTFYRATVSILTNPSTDKVLRPMLLSTIGDYALVSGGAFEPYIQETMRLVQAAQQIKIEDVNDEDQRDFVNSLRCAIFDVYTGLLQGLKQERKAILLQNYVEEMFKYIIVTCNDRFKTDAAFASALNLIGDAGSVLGGTVHEYLKHPEIQKVLSFGRKSLDDDVREASKWARNVAKAVEQSR